MVRKVKGFKYKENLIQYKATMDKRKEIEKEALDLMESIKKKEIVCAPIQKSSRDDVAQSFVDLTVDTLPKLAICGMDTGCKGNLMNLVMMELLRSRK